MKQKSYKNDIALRYMNTISFCHNDERRSFIVQISPKIKKKGGRIIFPFAEFGCKKAIDYNYLPVFTYLVHKFNI